MNKNLLVGHWSVRLPGMAISAHSSDIIASGLIQQAEPHAHYNNIWDIQQNMLALQYTTYERATHTHSPYLTNQLKLIFQQADIRKSFPVT